jgi:NhaA family Na+:H+ antiporter
MSESQSNWLNRPVDGARDHCLGDGGADITLLEYGSYDCPYCRGAHEVVANLRDRFGERMRYVFRHRPITDDDVAREAAIFVEYAHETTGQYWEAHDAFMKLGSALAPEHFPATAAQLALPQRDGEGAEAWRRAQAKVEEDIESARSSGVRVAPTFFINGRRYEGAWDENALTEAVLGSLGHRLQTAALDFARWAPSTGALLLLATVLALVLTNSPAGEEFDSFWRMPFGLLAGEAAFRMPLRDWINDGLLTIFFLVVGLEIKREFTVGRLASRRAAALPVAAAVGGMLLPALIYLAVAPSGPLAHGWAIPTTTDTAFAVAIIAMLGSRVPVELRIFLTAAVVIDDLAAIVIVAVFYSTGLDAYYAGAAAAVTGMLVFLNRSGIYRVLPYAVLGVILWSCLHASGLHATLAGVILAAVTPTRPPGNLESLLSQAEAVFRHELQSSRERVLRHGPSEPALHAIDQIHDRIESPAAKLLRSVEPWSSYAVLPLFALANAGVAWSAGVMEGHERLIAAIVLGLVLGKPLGMLAVSAIAVWAGLAAKPDAYSWWQLFGAGALAGIGFTMSLFIAGRSFPDETDFAAAKVGIFLASLIAGGLGTALLWRRRKSADASS